MTPTAPGDSTRAGDEKSRLRRAILARRAGGQPDPRDRAERALAACGSARRVACYASRADEPDTWELIRLLATAGVEVLLPVLRREPDWAVFHPTALHTGRLGIQEPTTPRRGAAALADAEAIILPGLAGTVGGDRLGTGGGWYDRALRHGDPHAPRLLLLNDAEVIDELPTEPWDQSVDVILTPTRTLPCPPRIPLSRTPGPFFPS